MLNQNFQLQGSMVLIPQDGFLVFGQYMIPLLELPWQSTTDCRLGGLIYFLTVLQAGSPRSRCHKGLFLHCWVFFLLWLHPFILSGVISPLISSSTLGTYWPGEFLIQYPIILPFHTVHGVLKARILKWFAIPFSSGPHSVRSLHHDPPILGCPTGMA